MLYEIKLTLMKTKTYILTLSRTFPKGHPREGEETNFAEKVKECLDWKENDVKAEGTFKRHTIRANYELWKHRIDEVNAGRAVLSVREWLGAPRRSKQRELFRLDKDSGIGVERLELNRWFVLDDDPERRKIYTVGKDIDERTFHTIGIREGDLAENDGLSLEDWRAWFRDYDRTKPMAIIHFTNFRYCK